MQLYSSHGRPLTAGCSEPACIRSTSPVSQSVRTRFNTGFMFFLSELQNMLLERNKAVNDLEAVREELKETREELRETREEVSAGCTLSTYCIYSMSSYYSKS